MQKRKTLISSFVIALLMTVGFANSAFAGGFCDVTPGSFDGHCWSIDTTGPDGRTIRTINCGDVAEDHPADCNKEGGSTED